MGRVEVRKGSWDAGTDLEDRITVLVRAFWTIWRFYERLKGKKGRTLDIAPQVDIATTEALRYMVCTKQRRTYLPYTFPANSRYSFTDPERMEGWVSPGPGCKEQLAHGCYTSQTQADVIRERSSDVAESIVVVVWWCAEVTDMTLEVN